MQRVAPGNDGTGKMHRVEQGRDGTGKMQKVEQGKDGMHFKCSRSRFAHVHHMVGTMYQFSFKNTESLHLLIASEMLTITVCSRSPYNCIGFSILHPLSFKNTEKLVGNSLNCNSGIRVMFFSFKIVMMKLKLETKTFRNISNQKIHDKLKN